jgi:hypothetical protein
MHAITAKTINAIAGRSGPEQLWIIDEACGFPRELWEVVLGNLMGGGHLLWLTNPTDTSGIPYEWATGRRQGCNLIQIDARENPNFSGGTVPGLATPEGVQQIIDNYGEESAEFDVRVRGRFPRQGSNAVIGLGLVQDAQERWERTPWSGPLVLGIDVARFGSDDSVITPRRGQKVRPQRTIHGMDTVAVATTALEVAEELRNPDEAVTLNVEVDGLGGGVYDFLHAKSEEPGWEWVHPVEVTVGAAAVESDKYVNRRSELWFTGAQWLLEGGALPPDPDIQRELVSPIYGFDTRLRRRVQSKDEIKSHLGRSPDHADSFLVSLAQPVSLIEDGVAISIPGRWSSFLPPTRSAPRALPTTDDQVVTGSDLRAAVLRRLNR